MYLGHCATPNTCIKSKCVSGGTKLEFLKIQDVFYVFILVVLIWHSILSFISTDTIHCDPHKKTLKRGGYHCNGPCINNNIEYHNWSLAWNKCKEVTACTRIFRWENGSHYNYYLWKDDDVFDKNKRYLYVDFDSQCRD